MPIDYEKILGELNSTSGADRELEKLGAPDPADYGGRAVPTGSPAPVNFRSAATAVADRTKTPEERFSLLRTIANVPRSAVGQVKGFVDVVKDPVGTLKGLGSAAVGGVQKLIPGQQAQEENFDAVVDFFKQRYGSSKAALRTLQEDPVGFATDIAGTLTLAGAGIKAGATASRVGQISRASRVASMAGDASTAARIVTEGAAATSAAERLGIGLSKVGEAIDPVAATVRGIGGAAGKVAAPFASSARNGIVEIAKRNGIELPASAMTESPVVQGVEAFARKGVTGGQVNEFMNDAKEAVSGLARKIADDIVPGASGDGLFPSQAGQDLGQAIEYVFDESRKTAGEFYEELLPSLGGRVTAAKNLEEAVREVFGQKHSALVDSAIANEAMGILSKIQSGKAAAEQAVRPGGYLKLPPFTYKDLVAASKEFGDRLNEARRSPRPSDVGIYEKFYASIKRDIDAVIEARVPERKWELKAYNKYFSDLMSDRESIRSVREAIRKGRVSNIVTSLVRKGEPDSVSLAKRVVSKEYEPLLKTAFTRHLLDQSMKDGVLSGFALKKAMRDYGLGVMQRMFSKEELTRLTDSAELAHAIETGTKIANGSQTAYLTRMAGIGGSALLNPMIALGAILGDAFMSKLVTTPAGRKWLTTGSRRGKAVGEAIRKNALRAAQVNFITQQMKAAIQK